MSTFDNDRSLTELEFVEVAARRAVNRVVRSREMVRAFLVFADELMRADSSLNGNADTRLSELNTLRRQQS